LPTRRFAAAAWFTSYESSSSWKSSSTSLDLDLGGEHLVAADHELAFGFSVAVLE